MRYHTHYVLDKDGEPIEEKDLETWAKWLEETFRDNGRVVKQEHIGDCMVSTVFLGLDHNWGDGPPVLWETMIFGGRLDQRQTRCAGSREQAEAMHQRMVKLVKEKQHGNVR